MLEYNNKKFYFFGNNVKDSTLFDNITTSTGALIGADGHYANVNLMERGFDVHAFIGYAYHPKENNLSGFYFSGGLGFLQHQIFIDTKSLQKRFEGDSNTATGGNHPEKLDNIENFGEKL